MYPIALGLEEDSAGKKMGNIPLRLLMVFVAFFMLPGWNADKACAQKMPSALQGFLKSKIGLSQKDIAKIQRPKEHKGITGVYSSFHRLDIFSN